MVKQQQKNKERRMYMGGCLLIYMRSPGHTDRTIAMIDRLIDMKVAYIDI